MNHDPRLKRKRRIGRALAACASILVIATARSASAAIEVNVTRVGFPTVRGGQMVRPGTWTPIIVDLALLNQGAFDGTLRTAQFDNDGDECYDSVEVHLRAETGGAQRLYLYALANPLRSQGKFSVELRDTEGEIVEVVSQGEPARQARPARQPITLEPDNLFVLSMSAGTLGRVVDLIGDDQRGKYERDISIGHMSPLDLPELWIGLEAVDCIVWEDATPDELTERQVEALLEWVRQGGVLLIFASRTAGSLKQMDSIDAVFPVDFGKVVSVDDLPEVRAALLDAFEEPGFDHPVPVAQYTLRDGSVRIASESAIASDVVTRRRVGRGHVIVAGVTQADLFSAPGSAVAFYRRVFHLTEIENPELGLPEPRSLFGNVISAVSFAQSGSLYLLIAALCSIVYFGAATFGSWSFLSAKGLERYSWSVFALAGLAASALSLILVNTVHGFGETLRQLSIVDADAGEVYGHATVFFGLKTGLDKEVDVWLPADPVGATEPGPTNCFLRPVPAGNDPADVSSYADPQEYRLIPGSAVVEHVRVRATLKQFEGRWEGRIGGGPVTGEIKVRRAGKHPKDWRFTEDSYIVNGLGVDLKDCYLLHTLFDIDDARSVRNKDIYAYPIGDVPTGGRKVVLASRCYAQGTEEQIFKEMSKQTLADHQRAWSNPFQKALGRLGYGAGAEAALALGEEQKALLLLSTIGEFSALHGASATAFLLGPVSWSRDRLGGLDLHEQLDNDSVILIGFAEDPGPIRLFRRRGDDPFRRCEPDPKRSWTMYRIRIPATVLGARPPRADDEELTDPYDIDIDAG